MRYDKSSCCSACCASRRSAHARTPAACARYICEEIEPETLAAQSNLILTAVIQGMRKEEPQQEVRLAATNALLNQHAYPECQTGPPGACGDDRADSWWAERNSSYDALPCPRMSARTTYTT